MVQLHLDQEAADVRPENGMDGMFFAGENLFHRAHLLARHHVQEAVVDRGADGDIALVVVGYKREVRRCYLRMR